MLKVIPEQREVPGSLKSSNVYDAAKTARALICDKRARFRLLEG